MAFGVATPSSSVAQVLFDETFDDATVIVPGSRLDRPIIGLDDRPRERRRERMFRSKRLNERPITRDDNVRFPQAVVPPAAIGNVPVETGPDGSVQVITDTYRVSGESYKDLWSSIQRAALGNGDLGTGDAQVSFQPRATYLESEGSCQAADPAVDLTVVLTFPEWDTASNEPRATEAFGRMLSYLRTHEAQHVLIARQYRKEMVEAITGLPAQATCDEMRATIAQAAAGVNELQIAAQRAFDRKERKNSAELLGRAK